MANHLMNRGEGRLMWQNPFKDMDDLFHGFFVQPIDFEQNMAQSIRVDVKEKPSEYVVHAEIPGAKKEDIDVSIEGGVITIGAETKREEEQKEGDKVLRSERFYGKMQRQLQLPHDIDEARAAAEYKDGILVLTLPKRAPDIQKKLTIK